MGGAVVKPQGKEGPPDSLRTKRSTLSRPSSQSSQLQPVQPPSVAPVALTKPAATALDTDAAVATVTDTPAVLPSPNVAPPVKPRPVTQPECSCMVAPKYVRRASQHTESLRIPGSAPPRRYSNPVQYQQPHLPPQSKPEEDNFELNSVPSAGADDFALLRPSSQPERGNTPHAQNGALQLMDCSFDSSAVDGLNWTQDKQLSAFLPFVSQGQLDEQSRKCFIEYLRSHVAESRGRNQHWFNVAFGRERLRKRLKHSSISWNPMEEIATFDLDVVPTPPPPPSLGVGASPQVPPPVTEIRPPLKGRRQRQQQQRSEQQQQQQQPPLLPPLPSQQQKPPQDTRPPNPEVQEATEQVRIREILSGDLAHRDQLAKKAIEDNALFICARTPFRFR